MNKKRSIGVTVLSILYILLGLLFLLAMPLFSILYIIVGIGIFLLKPFARYLAITVSILGFGVNTVKSVGFLNKNMSPQIIVALILTYLYYLGVIYFFTRPKVKKQFK